MRVLILVLVGAICGSHGRRVQSQRSQTQSSDDRLEATEGAMEVLDNAILIAQGEGHSSYGPAHVAASFFDDTSDYGEYVCSHAGCDPATVRRSILRVLRQQGSGSRQMFGSDLLSEFFQMEVQPEPDRSFDRMLRAAASQDGANLITQDSLLLALYSDSNVGNALREAGLTKTKARAATEHLHKLEEQGSSGAAEGKFENLDKYGVDMVKEAKAGKLDPTIGRDDEIRRAIQILSRRTKNNPIMVGEPGVGKTAVVEGLAQRIAEGDVPEKMKGIGIRTLDMASLIAGAKYQGEFEERLQAVLKEVAEAPEPGLILFIDEIHNVLGAGKTSGSMDAANILKPMLARGELRCIGATTQDEYKKYIEKDAAFERRFQPITVDEPSVGTTISILRGLRERYETHHGVVIEDAALVAAATLSDRYITERYLPDKAIDLVDEAAATRRVQLDSKPVEIDQLERRLLTLEIEATALKREKDEASEKRLQEVNKEIENTREKLAPLNSRWEAERKKLDDIHESKKKLEELSVKAAEARRNGDRKEAAKIEHNLIPAEEKKLKQLEPNGCSEQDSRTGMCSRFVTEAHVLDTVSRWTGVPVSRLTEVEKTRLLSLPERLRKRVIGQDAAVDAVANSVLRARAGLARADQPTGSFLFLGPTGVGKTELAKTLNAELFNGDERSLLRLDMSEYSEPHSVSRLVGSPPGYVGYDEGGQLTEAVRKRPYTVVLLDEIEKAHQKVLLVLLQVLDEGRLTDAQGRVVDFKNTVVILTSNIGGQVLLKGGANATEQALEQARAHFPPEFLNRLSDICVFQALDQESLRKIVQKAFAAVAQRLESNDVQATLTDKGADAVLAASYDPLYGARPIERYFEQNLVTKLSKMVLSGELPPKSVLHIDADEKGALVFDKTESK